MTDTTDTTDTTDAAWSRWQWLCTAIHAAREEGELTEGMRAWRDSLDLTFPEAFERLISVDGSVRYGGRDGSANDLVWYRSSRPEWYDECQACSWCDARMHSRTVVFVGHHQVHMTCASDLSACGECGALVLDGATCCMSAGDAHAHELLPYSFRPAGAYRAGSKKKDVRRISHPAGKVRYYGIEWETVVEGLADRPRGLADLCVPCSDSSLSDFGAEWKFAPHTLDALRARIAGLGERERQWLAHSISADGSCGIHVHISRSSAPMYVFARLHDWVVWDTPRRQRLVDHIAGRKANTYCARTPGQGPLQTLVAPSDSRYTAVNFVPEKTVEVRIFASGDSLVDVLRCVEYVDALMTFCEEVGHARRRRTTGFLEYMSENERRWPIASAHLKAFGG